MKIKLFIVCLVLFMFVSSVSATDSYIESMQKLREEQQESKKEIISAVVSFNAAFTDTFRLIDDEFSRLIYSMVGLVGVVFSIMFLVYAKTTSRYKRDIQILLKAHSKHIDNLVTTRLDEFISRLDSRMKQETRTALSRVEENFDSIVSDIIPPEEVVEQIVEVVKQPSMLTSPRRRFDEFKATVSATEGPVVESDGRVKVLKKPTSALNRFKKKIKSGLRKFMRKDKETIDVVEFKK